MFSKYLLSFCAIAVFSVAALPANIDKQGSKAIPDSSSDIVYIEAPDSNVNSSEIDMDIEESIAQRHGFVNELVKGIIKAGITSATINCINQAAAHCQDNWQDKVKTLKCGKDFLVANQGKCAFGIKA